MLLLLLISLVHSAPHVTLELSYSADSATVPTRAALATLPLGTPPRRRRLLLDFASQDIEIDGCHRTDSYSFSEQLDTDEVLFDAEHVTDGQPHTAARLPVRDHCNATGALSSRFYANCVGSRCEGVLGLARSSALWALYSAYSLSLDALRLGRSHPRAVPAGSLVRCNDETDGMCSFRALLRSDTSELVPVTVDLHLDNSYTRVPASALGARRLQLLDADGTGTLLLELDEELLEHAPSRLHAHSSSLQGAAGAFFGTYARTRPSSLLKPLAAEDARVELGNAALLRYAFHVDLLHNEMRIERRAIHEHVPLLDVLVAGVLFAALIRASLFAAEAPLQAFLTTPRRRRNRVPDVALFALAVAVVYAPARAHEFVDTPFDFVWLNIALAVNVALAAVTAHTVAAHAVAVEVGLCIALLQLASVTRTESLGGVGGVAIAVLASLLLFRHVYALVAARGRAAFSHTATTALNATALIPLLAWRVVYAYNHSVSLTALLFALALLAAGASVDAYAALAVHK